GLAFMVRTMAQAVDRGNRDGEVRWGGRVFCASRGSGAKTPSPRRSGGEEAADGYGTPLSGSLPARASRGERDSLRALAMQSSQPKAPEDWRSPRRCRAIRRFMVPMHGHKRGSRSQCAASKLWLPHTAPFPE